MICVEYLMDEMMEGFCVARPCSCRCVVLMVSRCVVDIFAVVIVALMPRASCNDFDPT
jgi:hypothetical protein